MQEEKVNYRNENYYKGRQNLQKQLQCKKCPYKTLNEQNLIRHIELIHGVLIPHKKFECHKCPDKFATKSTLISHVEAVHDKVRNQVCGDCGYATYLKKNLQRHIASKHNDGEKKFKCDKCPLMTFREEFELREHIRGVHDRIKDHVREEASSDLLAN